MMRFYTGRLGAEGYGAVGNIVDASTLLIAVVTLAIGESIIRFGLDKNCDKSDVFSIGMKTTLCGLIIFMPFVPFIGKIGFLSEFSLLIYLYVFTGSIKSSCALFVRSIGKIRLYAIDGLLTTTVNIALNLVFLAVFDMGVIGYVLSVVLADIASIIFLTLSVGLTGYFKLFGVSRQMRNSMFRYCVPLIPATIMWWITNVSDSFFISGMLGQSATGIYKAAYKFPNIIMLASGVFSQAWNMSAITEKNSKTIAKFYNDVFNLFQTAVYVLSAAMLLMIRPVLTFMAVGEGFTGEAFRHSPMLLLAVVFTCFSTFMGSIYVALKKSVRSMVTASIGAGLNILLNWILIPIMGIDGAALGTLVSYIVIFFARVFDTKKFLTMDLFPLKMAVNIALLTGMGLIVMFLKNNIVYYTVLSVLFALIILLNYRISISAFNFALKYMRGKNTSAKA
jgi:O-antigen/teichoic acid export membrane protein